MCISYLIFLWREKFFCWVLKKNELLYVVYHDDKLKKAHFYELESSKDSWLG